MQDNEKQDGPSCLHMQDVVVFRYASREKHSFEGEDWLMKEFPTPTLARIGLRQN